MSDKSGELVPQPNYEINLAEEVRRTYILLSQWPAQLARAQTKELANKILSNIIEVAGAFRRLTLGDHPFEAVYSDEVNLDVPNFQAEILSMSRLLAREIIQFSEFRSLEEANRLIVDIVKDATLAKHRLGFISDVIVVEAKSPNKQPKD